MKNFLKGLFDKESSYDIKSIMAVPGFLMVLLVVWMVTFDKLDPSLNQSTLISSFFWVVAALLLGGSVDFLTKKFNQK